jgi:hypothetical protein
MTRGGKNPETWNDPDGRLKTFLLTVAALLTVPTISSAVTQWKNVATAI